ncbi:hypothetical protein MRX96_024415, partial [Rhipicephalus microplus]
MTLLAENAVLKSQAAVLEPASTMYGTTK